MDGSGRRVRAEYAALASAADVSVRNFAAFAAPAPAPAPAAATGGRRPAGGGGDADDSSSASEGEVGGGDDIEDDNDDRALGLEHRQRQRQRRLCKSFVETDRCLRAAERGYRTWLMLLAPRACTPKNDLSFGYPREWEEEGEKEEGTVVMLPLLEGGGPLGPEGEAAAFDAWFGDARGGGMEEGGVEPH